MDPRVLIAIPNLAGPDALAATLSALDRHTPNPTRSCCCTVSTSFSPPAR